KGDIQEMNADYQHLLHYVIDQTGWNAVSQVLEERSPSKTRSIRPTVELPRTNVTTVEVDMDKLSHSPELNEEPNVEGDSLNETRDIVENNEVDRDNSIDEDNNGDGNKDVDEDNSVNMIRDADEEGVSAIIVEKEGSKEIAGNISADNQIEVEQKHDVEIQDNETGN
ncbi:MAG: hypothetical protein PHR78_06890, partial [Eubacteriales bacterium]|nr:hypothetical protein [Eubacteriales bacterium]